MNIGNCLVSAAGVPAQNARSFIVLVRLICGACFTNFFAGTFSSEGKTTTRRRRVQIYALAGLYI